MGASLEGGRVNEVALEIRPGPVDDYPQHVCPLPWPIDPEMPEGHACECGRRWVYRPAHWDPLLTLDELRMRQEAGAFLRGIIPTFAHRAELRGPTAPSLAGVDDLDAQPDTAVIVPIRPTTMPPPQPPT